MKEFTNIEKKAEEAENLNAFSGIKLLHIKKKVAEILALIGRYEIFDQYTKHDISHINQLLEISEWLIPEDTQKKLTPADCLMIVLSIYFHDLGMLVTKEEYLSRSKSGFVIYKSKVLDGEFGVEYQAKASEKYINNEIEAEHFLYQEFVRSKHAERIKYWIQGKQKDELGISDKIIEEINELLDVLPSKFRLDLGQVCESHHLSDLDNFHKYSVSFPYGRLGSETANMHYASLILRTCDLIHITSDRTPSTEFRLINPSDPISQIEWIKQMAVTNVRGKLKKNKEGKIDVSIPKDTIEVTAFFDSPDKSEAFFSLISYLNYSRKELRQCFYWGELAIKEHGVEYLFPWKDINDDNVTTQGFERELFQFNLDQNKILNLLVGHTLYNDSTVVLRELIQNSIDAIRLYRHQNKCHSDEKILINWNSTQRLLDITDTGTGMDRSIIENHLLKVGSSRYQDERFIKAFPDFTAISRFGIGVLTCFLVSNEIEITSITEDSTDALNLTIKDVDGKYLLRSVDKNDSLLPIVSHGTKISLKIRHDINMNHLINDIKKWILFPDCDVKVIIDGNKAEDIGYESPKLAIENYLKSKGFDLADSSLKIIEREYNGLTLAYALRLSVYFKEWHFMYFDEKDNFNSPIGTAVEGIRVEFDTPGFIGKRLIASANAKGKNAPKTNVARSIIEDTGEKSILLDNIYKLYIDHVKEEIFNLNKKNNFSITWSALEATFLLEPFFSSRKSDDDSSLKNNDLLNNSINSIEGVLIEINNERKAVSPGMLKLENEILTIDCDLYRSVEKMLKEVNNDSSLNKILIALYGEKNVDFKIKSHVLCGYDPSNILHSNALANKEVTGFKLHHDERRVDVVWKNISSKPIWYNPMHEFSSNFNYTNRNRFSRYYQSEGIRIQIGEINIEGLKNEIAIGAFYQTYLLKGSEFHSYIIDLIEKLNLKNDFKFFELFMSILNFGNNFLQMDKVEISREEIEKIYDRFIEKKPRSSESSELFPFDKFINKEDLIYSIQGTKWQMFDPKAWNREGPFF